MKKEAVFLNLCQDNGEMCALTSMHKPTERSNSSSMPDSGYNVKRPAIDRPTSLEAISAAIAIAIDDRSEVALRQLRQ